ncbi:MAG: hypothetical protein ACE5JM_12845, partial [Armatimonadota bacterium]
CISYVRGHILDKQYEFWWGKTILDLGVDQGRLIVCTFDLPGQLEANPVARQLLRNLAEYAGRAGEAGEDKRGREEN